MERTVEIGAGIVRPAADLREGRLGLALEGLCRRIVAGVAFPVVATLRSTVP